ncbi:hypothetical protein ACVWWN_003408 [Mycobacterium sp. URHB0021]
MTICQTRMTVKACCRAVPAPASSVKRPPLDPGHYADQQAEPGCGRCEASCTNLCQHRIDALPNPATAPAAAVPHAFPMHPPRLPATREVPVLTGRGQSSQPVLGQRMRHRPETPHGWAPRQRGRSAQPGKHACIALSNPTHRHVVIHRCGVLQSCKRGSRRPSRGGLNCSDLHSAAIRDRPPRTERTSAILAVDMFTRTARPGAQLWPIPDDASTGLRHREGDDAVESLVLPVGYNLRTRRTPGFRRQTELGR